jgi:hypothetical protein
VDDSVFRHLMNRSRALRGRRLQWPQLARMLVDDEFNSVRRRSTPYVADVFLDRDKHSSTHEHHPNQDLEVVSAQRLYRAVHRQGNGCVRVGAEEILLISYNVPNQGRHRRRCVDVLGLRLDGSLVAFECKRSVNSDTPLVALFEGLDYLVHLVNPENLLKLRTGFRVWQSKHRVTGSLSPIPAAFQKTEIQEAARHSVIVLAPARYFTRHWTDVRGLTQGWQQLSDRAWPRTKLSVRLDFATTDYASHECPLLDWNSIDGQ